MNRGNKGKTVKKTELMYTEGEHDQIFTRHLVSIYSPPHPCPKKITVRKGRGGDPHAILDGALKVPGLYSRTLIIMDNDRNPEQIPDVVASVDSKPKLSLILNTPCLEAMLIQILEPKRKNRLKDSNAYKKYFEQKYIPSNKRTSLQAYRALFTKTILDEARTRIDQLDLVLSFIERR